VSIGHIRDTLRSIGLEEEKSCTESKRVVSNIKMGKHLINLFCV
jgi:hypothetical protein